VGLRSASYSLQSIKLIAFHNNGGAVQTGAISLCQCRECLATGCGGRFRQRIHDIPVIGDDPHAQQIIAEVAKWGVVDAITADGGIRIEAVVVTAVNRIASRSEVPVLPEIRRKDSVDTTDVETGVGRYTGGLHVRCAGIQGKPATWLYLLDCSITLEIAHDILHMDAARVGAVDDRDGAAAHLLGEAAQEGVLAGHEGDDGDELSGGTVFEPEASRGGQDANIPARGIVGGAGAVGHPVWLVGVERGQAKLPGVSETTDQLAWVNPVLLVEFIVEIARWRVEMHKGGYTARAGGGNLPVQRRRHRQKTNGNENALQYAFHNSILPGDRNLAIPGMKICLTTGRSWRLHPALLGMNHPLQRFRHKFGMGHPRTSRPIHQRLIAVANVADVLGFVFVNGRIRINEPDRPAQPLDVGRLGCQERPSRPGAELVAVLPDHLHVVLFRL